jgi:hypothetical protein
MNAAEALRELSNPWAPGDRVKAAIQRAARLSGLSYWRCFDIWYGKARRIDLVEVSQITAAIEKKRELEAKNELQELRLRLAKLEARISQADENLYRPSIDWTGGMVGRLG